LKFFKGFFLTIMVFVLFVILELFIVNLALNKTIFSGKYFSNIFEKGKMGNIVADIAVDKIANAKSQDKKVENKKNSGGSKEPDIGSIMVTHLDKNWLQQQGPILVNGIQAYLVGDADKLPVIDVKPLKAALIEGGADQVLRENKGISRETAKAGVSKEMKLDSVKDSLDLNLAMEKSSSNGSNLLKDTREVIAVFKTIIFRTLLTAIALLIAIVSTVSFKVKGSIKWITGGLMSAGIVAIAAGITGACSSLSYGSAKNLVEGLGINNQSQSAIGLEKWVEMLVKGFSNTLLIAGIVVVLIAVVMMAAAKRVLNEQVEIDKNEEKPKKNKAAIVITRVLVTVLLLASIPMTVFLGIDGGKAAINKFNKGNSNVNVMKGIGEATGAEFLINAGNKTETQKK